MDAKSILGKYYYDVETGFVSADKLYKKVKKFGITLKKVKEFLEKQNLHERTATKKKTVNREMPSYSEVMHVDLVDMSDYKKQNEGYCWMFNAINSFTRVAYSYPLKTKSDKETAIAMKKLIGDSPTFKTVMTDDGSEWKGAFGKLLKEEGIKHITTAPYTPESNGKVERFNKTIKNVLFKYFKSNDTYKWVSILPKLVKNYNNTYHSIIKTEPSNVKESNKKKVFANIIRTMINTKITNEKKLKIGTKVRVWEAKKLFEKSYKHEWSNEIYTIEDIKFGIRGLVYDKYVVKNEHGRKQKKTYLLSDLKPVKANEKPVEQKENKAHDKKMKTAKKVAKELKTKKHAEYEEVDKRLNEPRQKRKGKSVYYGDMLEIDDNYGKRKGKKK